MMKFLLTLLVAAIALHQSIADLDSEWETYKKEFEKSFNPREDIVRKATFAKTLEEIEKHNAEYEAGIQTYEMGINEFADMTSEEFSGRLRWQRDSRWSTIPQQKFTARSYPESINWVEFGFKNPVLNQGLCGSCYAFAAAATIEAQYYIRKNQSIQLSQQEMIDCTYKQGNNMGCKYGEMSTTFKYCVENGVGLAVQNPYRRSLGDCKKEEPRYNISSYYSVPSGDEVKLMEAVATVGPVVVAINSNPLSFKHYNGGFYNDAACTEDGVNHFVTVVGYGNKNGEDYWLVKNSWGTRWGEDGFMYLARNRNLCGIAIEATYPVL